MTRHEVRLRVRYAETDQMGIVYHANYLVWMEVGRVEYFRNAGMRYADFEKQTGLHLAVVEASCRYLSPARYDDEVAVLTGLGESNPRLVRFEYEIRNAATGVVLATGFTRHIFLDGDMKARKLPVEMRPLFGLA
ncbi:MAG: thioesterase family protein [Bryobacteraceae bacterium]